MRSNSIRFTGMASGMDTDSIVRDMMRPQQLRIDNQKKQQALLQLKQDAWRDMNKKLLDFHRNFTEKMSREITFKQNLITSSNPGAISIGEGATAPQGTHIFEVTQLAESASIVKKIEGSEQKIGEDITLSFEIGGKDKDPKKIEIEVNEDQTYEEVAKLVAGELSKNGFSSNYSDGYLFATSKNTGADEKIIMDENYEDYSEITRKLFVDLGLIKEDGTEVAGKNAEYTYNGTELDSATNKIEINGIKATLKAVTTGPVTIASEPDTDAIYTWVEDFVKGYNELIDEINLKIGTKPSKDYMPLTAEERETMSESEIKLWEEKINGSLFYQDEQLTRFVNSARSILGQMLGVDDEIEKGKPNSLASLGIVTGSWEEKGKLYIQDEDEETGQPNKLRAAIEKDPEGVAKLLNTLGKQLYDEHEKTLRTSNELKSAMNFYNDKVMNDKLKDFEKQIKTLEDRLYRIEERYYAKFAAMEKMLSTLNNQSSWLAQQFGGY